MNSSENTVRLSELVEAIRKAISDFVAGEIDLPELTNGTNIPTQVIANDYGGEWADDLRAAWWGLETVYAFDLDEETEVDDAERDQAIAESLEKLRVLLDAGPTL